MFAKHGFHNVAERIKLGRFLLERFAADDLDKFTVAERMRMSFEQLGPTFVKLGQLLATRPDLAPIEFVEEFKKLHDSVLPLPFSAIEAALESHYKADFEFVFSSFEETPLGSASIAQVHRAKLRTGEEVVVKVQRPGIIDTIQDDLSILYLLADLIETYIPESKVFNPKEIVDEFFKTLELETNFVIEANNIRRFYDNFKHDPQIRIPKVYMELSGPKVLVMEFVHGIPLSQLNKAQTTIDGEQIVRTGLRGYLKMVFQDGLFHGDLHAGNILIMNNNQIGIVDFGVVGRLNRKTIDAIASIILALSKEDYDRLAYEFMDLAPFSGFVDVDLLAKELRDHISPYFGLTFKNVNIGRLLLDSAAITAKHQLKIPSELMLFFKSIVTVEGMGRLIVKDFDLLSYTIEMATELMKVKYSPDRMVSEALSVLKDSRSLVYAMPRQIKQILRRVNNPDFAVQMEVRRLDELKRSVETSSNILFLGIIIGSLILSGSLLVAFGKGPYISDSIPLLSASFFLLATALGVVAVINYIKK